MIGENCANKVRKQKGGPFLHAEPNCKAGFKMAGQSGKAEGSISGVAILEAIASLEKSLAGQPTISDGPIAEKEEQEHISLHARVAPLREMLRHATQIDSYVMWRPE